MAVNQTPTPRTGDDPFEQFPVMPQRRGRVGLFCKRCGRQVNSVDHEGKCPSCGSRS